MDMLTSCYLPSITEIGDAINDDRALTSCYLPIIRITEIGKLTTKNNDEINRLVMDEEGGSGFR